MSLRKLNFVVGEPVIFENRIEEIVGVDPEDDHRPYIISALPEDDHSFTTNEIDFTDSHLEDYMKKYPTLKKDRSYLWAEEEQLTSATGMEYQAWKIKKEIGL